MNADANFAATARERINKAAKTRILIKDGPYGTAIQNAKLSEEEYTGDTGLTMDQKGNNDLVNLTQPQVIRAICDSYIASGSTILATNTFNANQISQADYGAEHLVREINISAAKVIREACDEATAKDGLPRFVCGAMGPTNKTLSLSPDVEDPGFREVDFDEVKTIYREQAEALVDGGCDFILIETVFDTLNCKAAIMAVKEIEMERGHDVPLLISLTLTDMSGRNLSGHTVEAFWHTQSRRQLASIAALAQSNFAPMCNCSLASLIRCCWLTPTQAFPMSLASMTSCQKRPQSWSGAGQRQGRSIFWAVAAALRLSILARLRMPCAMLIRASGRGPIR